MQVVLKVVGGKNDGRKISVSDNNFVIGRGKEAHLRPSSDLISRQHCAIRLLDNRVVIEDMGSRNGTFVNGKQLTSAHEAKSGDNLRVGRMQFEVLVDHTRPDNKKPMVTDVADAAARTAKSDRPSSIEDSISDWLSDPEDNNFEKVNFRNRETIQFNLDELQNIQMDSLGRPDSESSDSLSASSESASSDSSISEPEAEAEDEAKKKKKKRKKTYGKLPPRPKHSHGDSTTAADDVLKKFFNRR